MICLKWLTLSNSLRSREDIDLHLCKTPISALLNKKSHFFTLPESVSDEESLILAGDEIEVGTDFEESILGSPRTYKIDKNQSQNLDFEQNVEIDPNIIHTKKQNCLFSTDNTEYYPRITNPDQNLCLTIPNPFALIHITDSQLAHVTRFACENMAVISQSGIELAQISLKCPDLPCSKIYVYTFGSNDLLHQRSQWKFPFRFFQKQAKNGAQIIFTSVPYLNNPVKHLTRASAFNKWLRNQCQKRNFIFIHNPYFYYPKRDQVHLTPAATFSYFRFVVNNKHLKDLNLQYLVSFHDRYKQQIMIRAQKARTNLAHYTRTKNFSNPNHCCSFRRIPSLSGLPPFHNTIKFNKLHQSQIQVTDLIFTNSDVMLQSIIPHTLPSNPNYAIHTAPVPSAKRFLKKLPLLPTPKQPLLKDIITLPTPHKRPLIDDYNPLEPTQRQSLCNSNLIIPVHADYIYGTDNLGHPVALPKLYGFR